jgi:prepilin-type N-terminal cleavage/methylation domain-containing protein
MKKDFSKNQKGFTLIETLVAVAIFASAITGLIAITAGGVANTNFVKNKFTAGYLAMEGAELIRNLRDTAAIANPNATWDEVISSFSACLSPNYCFIDALEDFPPQVCDTDGCDFMTYQESSGKFGYGAVDNTTNFASVFRRNITVEPVQPGDSTSSPSEIRVYSSVDWLQGRRTHTVTYSYNLKNWINP